MVTPMGKLGPGASTLWLLALLSSARPLASFVVVPPSALRPAVSSLSRDRRSSRWVSLAKATASPDRDSDGPAPTGLAKRGVEVALAYSTISAGWYTIGMVITLLAMPNLTAASVAASAGMGATRRAVTRLSKAWVLTFAASQVTTPWRAAGAVAFTPVVNRLLRWLKTRLAEVGLKAAWMPPLLYAASLAWVFGCALFAMAARELALVALAMQ
mmetsp:Transcript_67416/g.185887  ORF Transcript_67416/g.185887 Transcript_67416/m.185887 type:complete len:214 (-) Transcript_67416:1441-2082(-)